MLPGTIGQKVQSGKFLIYDGLATIEEAIRECGSQQDYNLVVIDTISKLTEVENTLINVSKHQSISYKFWTGGYLNVSMENPSNKNFEWLGSTKITPYSKELFKQFTEAQLNVAIQNRLTLLKNKECKDVARHCSPAEESLLYVGLHHPKTNRGTFRKGLTILNPYLTTSDSRQRNSINFHVICEEKG